MSQSLNATQGSVLSATMPPTTTLTGAGAEMLNPVFSALDQSEKRLLARDLMLKYKRNNTRAKIINKNTSKIIIKRVLFIKKPKLKI